MTTDNRTRLRGAATVTLLAAALFTAAVAPTVAMVATQDNGDLEVAEGRTGYVDPGREDNEEQQFPFNITIRTSEHAPGSTGADITAYASGLTEDIRVFWGVVDAEPFDVDDCTPQDASVFGIDRGNDDEGTTTDENLLTSYKSFDSTTHFLRVSFYKEEQLAGSPVKGTVDDQVVVKLNGCVDLPSDTGWYRVTAFINGSTKFDTTKDYTIGGGSQYIYVCDCSSREEARETLGPPPNEQGESSEQTPEPTATPDATPTPTAEPETPTATAEATPTAAPETATAGRTTATQVDENSEDVTATTRGDDSSRSTARAARGTRTARGQSGQAQRAVLPETPTVAEGPGFGPVVALLALVVVALVSRRQL